MVLSRKRQTNLDRLQNELSKLNVDSSDQKKESYVESGSGIAENTPLPEFAKRVLKKRGFKRAALIDGRRLLCG
jgi:hypothetical protein